MESDCQKAQLRRNGLLTSFSHSSKWKTARVSFKSCLKEVRMAKGIELEDKASHESRFGAEFRSLKMSVVRSFEVGPDIRGASGENCLCLRLLWPMEEGSLRFGPFKIILLSVSVEFKYFKMVRNRSLQRFTSHVDLNFVLSTLVVGLCDDKSGKYFDSILWAVQVHCLT